MTRKKLSSFFRITNHSNFGTGRFIDSTDSLLKLFGYLIAVGYFPALPANLGRYVFDNDNVSAHIGSKSRKAFFCCSFTHKTNHCLLLCLKSSVQSTGLGKYAVMSHSSSPFEPQTTCRGFSAVVSPSTKQLGKG